MSTEVFPTLIGQGWSIKRTGPIWRTEKQRNISGKEVSKARWAQPLYLWEVLFNVLRTGVINAAYYTEYQTLVGFFNSRQGADGTFLYSDGDDNSTTGQFLGIGDGGKTAFQLFRSFGGSPLERIKAPNLSGTFNVYLNGVLQSALSYTVTLWETVNANGPGCVVFTTPPGAGVFVTADFSFFWPCRFAEDSADFTKIFQGRYELKKLTFRSIK